MKSTRIFKRLIQAFILTTCLAASAEPISFTFSTTGTGSLGATSFTNAAITVTGTYDTAGVVYTSTNVVQAPTLLTFTIQGVGSATELTPGEIGINTTYYYLDLEHYPAFGQGFFELDSTTAFNPVDLSGPISIAGAPGNGAILQMTDATNAGTFLDTQTGPSTFVSTFGTVSPTPEPSSIALLGTGVVGIACNLRKRLVNKK